MIYKTKEKVITMEKNIYDCKHVKGVSAIALYKAGKPAGKIICNWSDNPAGTVCTAQETKEKYLKQLDLIGST